MAERKIEGINKRSDGRYMFRYSNNGKRHTVYAKTLSEIKQKKKEIELSLEKGIDIYAAKSTTLNDCFKDLIDSKKNTVSETTITDYMQLYNTHVLNSIGICRISEIKPKRIDDLYNTLLYQKKLSKATVKKIDAILKQCFDRCIRLELIESNPCNNSLKLVSSKNNKEIASSKKKALTKQEQSAFMEYVNNSPIYNQHLPVFRFMLGTGCRFGEVAALQWKDIDFRNETISINKTLSYKTVNGHCDYIMSETTKTISGMRTIPMFPIVRKILLEEKEKRLSQGLTSVTVKGFNDFVFRNSNNTPITLSTFNKHIKCIIRDYNKSETGKALKENRTPLLLPDFSTHILRHTFATRLCEVESNLKVIQEIMGHSDIAITMNIYADATQDQCKESFKSIENMILIG